MYDFPSCNDDCVSYDRNFDRAVFQSQSSVRTTDSLVNEFVALAEEASTSDSASKQNLFLSKLLMNDSPITTDNELGLCHGFMTNEISEFPTLMDLNGLPDPRNDRNESSWSESDDSSVPTEERVAWTAYLDRSTQHEDTLDFDSLPGLENLDQEDWVGSGVNGSSTAFPDNLADCDIVMNAVHTGVIPKYSKRGKVSKSTPTKSATFIKAGTSDTKTKKTRPNHDPVATERKYETLNEANDVAMGRGGRTNKFIGNRLYHAEKLRLQDAYHAASKDERTVIAQKLVDQVHARDGRFLKHDGIGWYIVSNHTARTKAGQALRERYTAQERAEKRRRYSTTKKKANAPSNSTVSTKNH